MANIRAQANGNWTETATWFGGVVPTASDDVYSNTFTVTIDTSPTVLSISNAAATGVTAGGGFSLNNGVNLTCTNTLTTCVSGLLQFSLGAGNAATITANSSFGGVPSSATVISNSSGGTLNYVGNVGYVSSSSQARIINNIAGGTVNITGNVSAGGGNGGSVTITVLNAASGIVNITGSVSSSTNTVSANSTTCITNASNGIINITGSCILSHIGFTGFINNSSTGQIAIIGSVFNNTTDTNTVSNSSSGTLTINGTVTAQNTVPVIAAGSVTQNTFLTGPFIGTALGVVANNAARWRWIASVGSSYMTVPNSTATGYKNLFTADFSGSGSGQAAVTNVRSGTVYGPANELTGTCAVPGASSVASGIPVDATTGTAVLTATALRSAMGLASANLDTQLAAIPTTTAPSASTIASAVWGTATRTITTTIPTAADIATAVWAATTRTLTTASDNSSTIATAVWAATVRTITGGTVTTLTNAPTVPTAAQIATATRTELAPELARVANCATVESTGDQIVALTP
jgi:hypothetical protein